MTMQRQSLIEVEYPSRFQAELAPAHLSYVCAINGMKGPDPRQRFGYCELGCGTGATTNVLAAANPHGQFTAIDLSATHIAKAQAVADEGAVGNVRFLACDISRLDDRALPEFDYVALHGLYSWVDPGVQDAIHRFIARKLRPGGVVYVSYNAMPGWNGFEGVRRFVFEAAARMSGDPASKTVRLLEQLSLLRDKGAPFFRETPLASAVMDKLRGSDPAYLAHELLSTAWQPLYFSEVNAAMASIGLHFAGSAKVLDNLFEHSTAPEFVAELDAMTDRCEREAYHDFIHNRSFRRDVYVRSDRAQARMPLTESLATTVFGMIPAADDVSDRVVVYGGRELSMSGLLLDRLTELLALSAMSLDELRDDRVLKDCPVDDLLSGLLMLSIERQVAPFVERASPRPAATASPVRIVPAINRHLIEEASERSCFAASPVAGTGIPLTGSESLLLRALENADPLSWLSAQIERRARKALFDGVAIDAERGSRTALHDAVEYFRTEKLAKLAYLGIVEKAGASR